MQMALHRRDAESAEKEGRWPLAFGPERLIGKRRPGAKGQRPKAFFVALALLASAFLLAACDATYDLVIENHTEQEVMVTVYGRLNYRLPPCSVQMSSITGPASRQGSAIRVEVTAADGKSIVRAEAQPKAMEGHTRPVIYVRIPQEGESACPPPVKGTFLLVVKSYSREEATVWFEGKQVGTVKPLAEETFGPLPGGWDARKDVEIRGADGKPLTHSIRAEYSLGEVPRFLLGFQGPAKK